jgi:hypothetical protein
MATFVGLLCIKINEYLTTSRVYAKDGYHMEIVRLMIEKGANNWNDSFIDARSRGNIEIIKIINNSYIEGVEAGAEEGAEVEN